MKKTLMILLLTLIVALSLGISACDMFQHKHTFSSEWSYDKEQHWLKATCEHTEEISSQGPHNWNSLNMCTTCGYVKELPPTDYTVTFDANGGKMDYKMDEYEVFETPVAVDSAISANVYQKLTPVLEGFEFTGWHVGDENGKLWDFENDIVSGETKLVASWKALFEDFEVRFYLNDGTDAEPVVKTTEKGKIDFVPEREGYVFTGWWFGSGNRDSNGYYVVTSKYDANKPLTANGNGNNNLYATWEEESSHVTVLSAPDLKVEGGTVVWNKVEGATKYLVKVSGGVLEEPISNTVEAENGDVTPQYTLRLAGGSYKVTVCSVGDGKTSVTSGYAAINVSIDVLPGVSISFDATTSRLTWTSADNKWNAGCSYKLIIDGVETERSLNVTYYDMTGYQAGQHNVTVVASKSGYQSSSSTKTITKYKLSTPKPVIYSNSFDEDFVITWDEITGADEYHIQIGSKTLIQTENSYTVKANSNAEKSIETFTVYAANSNAFYIDSDVSQGLGWGTSANVSIVGGNNNFYVTYNNLVFLSYKVTFDNNYEDGGSETVTVNEDKPLQYKLTSRTGYIFKGWYVDKNCTELYDFSKELTGDVTLYAGWRRFSEGENTNTEYVNFVSRYNSSGSAYVQSISKTEKRYVYFTAYDSGTYTLTYANAFNNNSSNYQVRFKVYAAGTYSSLVSVTSYTRTYNTAEFEVMAGTVYCIELSMNNTYYSAGAQFYVTGASYPDAGGVPNYKYTTNTSRSLVSSNTTVSVMRGMEIVFEIPESNGNKVFAGWYNGDELVSTDRKLVVTVSTDCPYLTYDGTNTFSCNLQPRYK